MAPLSRSTRTAARAALLGLAATVALTACSDQPKGTITAVTTGAPTPSTATAAVSPAADEVAADEVASPGSQLPADPALSGTQKVVIVPVPSPGPVLALDDDGRLNPKDGASDFSQFVFTRVDGGYLIRTAKADDYGTTSCMRVQRNGSRSLTVMASDCDADAANQVFTVTRADPGNADQLTYAISNLSAFLQLSSGGELIAEELGGGQVRTTFKLVSSGKVALPPLD
jgi:hypothetical protein